MVKQKIQHWTTELNGATRNWQQNRMWYGASNKENKTVHVNDGTKLCSICVRSNFPTKKLKELFETLFGVKVIGNSISYRG